MTWQKRLVVPQRTTIVLDDSTRDLLPEVLQGMSLSSWIRAAVKVSHSNPRVAKQIQEVTDVQRRL